MPASQRQPRLDQARGAGVTFGPGDTHPYSTATPGMSEGSATAAGHGDHPVDNADVSNVTLPGTRIGPQNEDLDGEQVAAPGDGVVMEAQIEKKHAGWGEEGSLTSDLERQKSEQRDAREEIRSERRRGVSIDGGAGNRVENEGMSAV